MQTIKYAFWLLFCTVSCITQISLYALTADDLKVFSRSKQIAPIFNPTEPYDDLNHSVFMGFGAVRNGTFINDAVTSQLFQAFNVHYELKPFNRFLVFSKLFQDALSVEIGVFYYTIINFTAIDEAFRVATPYGSGKLHFWLSKNFAFFLQASYGKNYVIEKTNNIQEVALALLNTELTDFGGGFYANIGPGWYWKTHIGYSLIYTGIALRF